MGATNDQEQTDWNARKKIEGFTQGEDAALGDAFQQPHDRDALAEQKRRHLEQNR